MFLFEKRYIDEFSTARVRYRVLATVVFLGLHDTVSPAKGVFFHKGGVNPRGRAELYCEVKSCMDISGYLRPFALKNQSPPPPHP